MSGNDEREMRKTRKNSKKEALVEDHVSGNTFSHSKTLPQDKDSHAQGNGSTPVRGTTCIPQEQFCTQLEKLANGISKQNTLPDRITALESRLVKDTQDILSSLKITEQEAKKCSKLQCQNRLECILAVQRELKTERYKVSELQTELACAQQQILQLETYTRKHNIIIEGMPEKQGETCVMGSVLNLLNKSVELPFEADHIDKAHRYGHAFNGKPRPIVARFVKISSRDLMMKNIK